jgi:hypothetical protein
MKNVNYFTIQSGSMLGRVARWCIFEPKKFHLGKFWSVLHWIILVHFMVICSILLPFGLHILRPFDIVCGNLVYFILIWYIFPILVRCTKKNLATLILGRYGCRQIYRRFKYRKLSWRNLFEKLLRQKTTSRYLPMFVCMQCS